FAGTKASDNAGQVRKETKPIKNYILLPLWTIDPPYSQDPKSSHDDGSKPLSDGGKKVDKDPRKDSECNDQEKEDNVNSTNNVNVASTNKVNVVGEKTSIKLPFDPNMPALEDYSIFDFSRNDEDDGAEADMNNLDTTIQEEPKKVIHALKDPSWIEAMEEELLQFKLQEVWTLVDLPNRKRSIGTKWVFRNKKDERGIVIRNKARLVAQGYTQEEGIDYNEVVSLNFIKSNKNVIDTLQDFGTMPIFKRTFAQDLDLLEQHLTKEIISQTDCKTILTKLRTTFENAFNSEFKERMQKYTRFDAQSFKDAMICNMDSIGKYMLEIILHQQQTPHLLKQKKLMQT
ncbi:putative ribonuclease H-like domain-containing protein, partial [Tanacetum coccineum]